MVQKKYEWEEGAKLGEHSKRKHKILAEYFRDYLITRCKLPQQERFRLAIIDGFCGAGIYQCGSDGSPVLFIKTLRETFEEINIGRKSQGMHPIEIECTLIFNDNDDSAIEQLKINVAPLLAEIKENIKGLYVDVNYQADEFENIYPVIKHILQAAKYRNVLFNLDQCGYSHVSINVIKDIMHSWDSAEVFLTFMISTLLAYFSPDQNKNRTLAALPEVRQEVITLVQESDGLISKTDLLGEVEKIVFNLFKECARFVSPFSINNAEGWHYWLMHFASRPRARQVYNDVLHANSALQAHSGRSGLRMLAYDSNPVLYLFDDDSRTRAKEELHDDIPRLITEYGDAISIEDFYAASYNETPAHSDDIHEMIILNPDVEVITPQGGERKQANTIRKEDTLKLKSQKSFFPMFLRNKND